MADLLPMNNCPSDCEFYDGDESNDDWYQWCHHPNADDGELDNEFNDEDCLVICPIDGREL